MRGAKALLYYRLKFVLVKLLDIVNLVCVVTLYLPRSILLVWLYESDLYGFCCKFYARVHFLTDAHVNLMKMQLCY